MKYFLFELISKWYFSGLCLIRSEYFLVGGIYRLLIHLRIGGGIPKKGYLCLTGIYSPEGGMWYRINFNTWGKPVGIIKRHRKSRRTTVKLHIFWRNKIKIVNYRKWELNWGKNGEGCWNAYRECCLLQHWIQEGRDRLNTSCCKNCVNFT